MPSPRDETLSPHVAPVKSLDFDRAHLLPVAAIEFLLVSYVETITDKLELEALLRYGVEIGHLVEVFDLLDRVVEADPPILQTMLLVELLAVQVLRRLVGSGVGLLFQRGQLGAPRVSRVRHEDSRLYVVQQVEGAIIEHLGQPVRPLAACRR